MKDTLIISAFPASGKTYATKYFSEKGVTVLDSDSSKFSWIINEKGEKVRNPNFVEDYMKHISENIGKVDCIFVSSHKEVREALKKLTDEFLVVYPDKCLKDEWIERCFLRGNSPEFCQKIADHWDEWIDDIEDDFDLCGLRLKATCPNIVSLLNLLDFLKIRRSDQEIYEKEKI